MMCVGFGGRTGAGYGAPAMSESNNDQGVEGEVGMRRLNVRSFGAWYLVALLASFAVRMVLATDVPGPVLTDDGLGYLGNARWLAGVSTPDFTGSNFYSLGYSALLAPLYVLGLGPDAVVFGARLVNGVAATLVAVPLGLLAASVWPDLGRERAMWSGFVVSLSPALLLQPAFMWPETVLPLVFAVWAVAVTRAVEGARGGAMALSLSTIAAVAVHARATPLLIASGLVLLVDLVRRGHRAAGTIERALALVALPVGFLLVRAAESAAKSAMWASGEGPRNAGATDAMLDRLAPERWPDLLEGAAGQLWYLANVSFGLVILGLVLVVGCVVRKGFGGVSCTSRRWSVIGIGLGAVALLALSVIRISTAPRVDHAVYGRYNEMWAPVVAVLAVGWVMLAEGRLRRAAMMIVPILGAGVAAKLLVDAERLRGDVMSLNVLGVAGLQSLFDDHWQSAFLPGFRVLAITAMVATFALAVGSAGRAMLPALAAGLLVVGLTAHLGTIASFRDFWSTTMQTLVSEAEARPDPDPIGVDLTVGLAPARNALAFWLGDESLRVLSPEDPSSGGSTSLVLSPMGGEDRCRVPIVSQPVLRATLSEVREGCLSDG